MEGENGCSNYYKQVFYLLNDDNSYKFVIIAKKKLNFGMQIYWIHVYI